MTARNMVLLKDVVLPIVIGFVIGFLLKQLLVRP